MLKFNTHLGIDRKYLINKNLFEISANFICCYCEMIAFDPKVCKKCKSVSCLKCVETKINCKKCNFILGSNLVQFSNRELAVLNAFKLRCPNLQLGCTDISVYKDFFNHVNSCKYNKQGKEEPKIKESQVDKGENIDTQTQIIHKTFNQMKFYANH